MGKSLQHAINFLRTFMGKSDMCDFIFGYFKVIYPGCMLILRGKVTVVVRTAT